MWPNARISVMGGDQAAMVLSTVRAEGQKARDEEWADEDRKGFEDGIRARYDEQGHPYYASARLWDDGVIDPVETRGVLAQALAASCENEDGDSGSYGVFRM